MYYICRIYKRGEIIKNLSKEPFDRVNKVSRYSKIHKTVIFLKGVWNHKFLRGQRSQHLFIRITSDPFSIPCVNRMLVIDPNRNTSVVVYVLLNQLVRLM